MEKIPIFIITCDRLVMLKQVMQSYHDCICTPFEIVILDQGTTYPATIKHLKKMKNAGVKVYRWATPNDGVNRNARRNEGSVKDNILDYFKTHPASNYVVTDPDILLDNVSGDIFKVYAHFLKTMPEIAVVGAMLRIDDIPDCFPLKKQLISGERGCHKRFASAEMHTAVYDDRKIRYIRAAIDTTFAMNRAGTHWRRSQKGIRIMAPYGAKHLDWYIDPNDISADQKYYMEHSSTNAHWSNWGKW